MVSRCTLFYAHHMFTFACLQTNVLVDSKDTPRIAGLGSVLIHWQSPPVARSEESRVPRSSAPELADPEAFGLPGPQPTKASDIYALGVLAYQVKYLLTPIPTDWTQCWL